MTTKEPMTPGELSADEIEIRLGDIIQFFKDSRRTLLVWTAVFLVIGAVYAFSLPNEFTSTVRVMPELKTPAGAGGLGDLKSLAGLAGVSFDNLSGTSEAIRPDLYPDIVQSVPFSLHLLQQPVTSRSNAKSQSLEQYLIQQDKSWIGSISGDGGTEETSLRPSGSALQLTKKQEELSKKVSKRVSATIDKKSGIVTITSQMPDPVVAATTANQTLNYLTTYVTNYRTGKSRKQVQFLSQQVNNARHRYQAAEFALSSYRDRNRSLFLETAKIEEQRLQADYLLAQTVYNDLSKQLEQARIKVQEESPVFQILEPAQVPLLKSGPKRTLIVLAFAAIGGILGFLYALFSSWRRYALATNVSRQTTTNRI
ncbi:MULTISPECIES: Wzz/FepE/Etk N-terminal domain-containing protein [Spirosoma]|uniref:Lipopolysaccharide biosynthesis protein n=1 Tax=Spirosoma sordidisoli TaxID=2502893 RepID=A0A4Q2UNZ4_9BACT|nr:MULTISPECIES: Wzz/FepE/Etk N-terminal domain-containing protein [Spirosoma]RYC68539.1 lipopolysaccharide biosynthesis protein [Spirosoma sordidisoli]